MYTIITKDNCPWCVKAKDLLKNHNIPFKELNIPYSFSQEEFYTLIKKHNTTKTVPKVFYGEELIGGYEELVDWVENHSGGFGEGSL